MTNEQLNTKLYEKLFAEQEKYREWLLSQPPEEILNHAYEYVMREDIVIAMEYHDLTDAQANALIASPSPLADIFHDFEKIEGDHMEIISDCIEHRANRNIAKQAEALRSLPVYAGSGAYAREHGEIEAYRASFRANVACKDAIDDAIKSHYADNRLDPACVRAVVDRYGYERTAMVLANTVQHKDWDMRISSGNRTWANSIPVPNDLNAWGDKRTTEYVCSRSHTGLIDLFVTQFRSDMERERAKKPSVLKKLHEAKADMPKKSPGKAKEASL